MSKTLMVGGFFIAVGIYSQVPPRAVNTVVIPTRITFDPKLFGKGQSVAVKASFQQPAFSCFLGKDSSEGFAIKLYDEKIVTSEPIWETKSIAESPASTAIKTENNGKKVDLAFDPLTIPPDASGRIYAVVWRRCSFKQLVDPTTVPPIYEERVNAKRIGGQFFRFSCPGPPKPPIGRCAYQPE